MFLCLLEKDFIYFEINPRLPKCTVCFQVQHMRAVPQGHIAEGFRERCFQCEPRSPACNQLHGSRGATVLGLKPCALFLQGL